MIQLRTSAGLHLVVTDAVTNENQCPGSHESCGCFEIPNTNKRWGELLMNA
jgi:hypothetical protein